MVTQPPSDGPAFGGSITFSRVVDLSWPIHPGIPRWPGDPSVEFETVADIEEDGYFLRRFSMGEHSGTHLSAPSGFRTGASGHECFSPQDLVRPAIVIDITTQAEADWNYALTMNDILDWESEHGPVPQGCVALLRTGWQVRWSRPVDYLGGPGAGQLHFPGFGLEAAQMLLEGRSVAGLGADTAGVEPGVDTGFSVSRLALENRLIVLENLTNLELLPPTGTLLVVGLVRLEGGSGGPAAVTALVP
ncbi:MAG: cyclase family protein [Chloroflexi bacterium]|nr:cyclase family protein [Chloroflexota bacterium]